MNLLQLLASLALLLTAAVQGAAVLHGCTFKGQNYENFDIFDHSNGCAKLQCQYGQTVTYYEACGKDKDGNCHRLNYMFEFKGTTYQCRKVPVAGGFDYVNEVAIPRIENCTANGRTYQTFEKFKVGNGCREYQCQNGEVVSLDAQCEPSIDGKCHRFGETFEKDGTVYTCTSRVVNGDTVYKVVALDPQPTSTKPPRCRAGGIDHANYEIYTVPPSCDVRQCQNREIKILANSCLFRKGSQCYNQGEQWVYQDETYQCSLNTTKNDVEPEKIAKGFGKCKRQEHWFGHLEILIRDEGCVHHQCQDGKTLPVKEGCYWSEDGQCHDLNSIWRQGEFAYKCIIIESGAYRVYKLDENGNLIDKPESTTQAPIFGEHCPALKADIIFMLDASQSIAKDHFTFMLDFLASLLTAFNIGPDNVRVAALVFSDTVKKAFDLKTYSDYDSVTKAIKEIDIIRYTTDTDKALNFVVDDGMFGTAAGGRDDAPNILMVITDGNSTDTDKTLAAAKRVKAIPAEVITVGIGRIIEEELQGIATSPENVFHTPSYMDLYSLITTLTEQTCKEIIKPTEPPTEPTEPPTEPTEPPTEPTAPPTTKPPKPECPEVSEPPGCPDVEADIIFLLDSSSGVGSENYEQKLKLAVQITDTFTVSPENVQVGAVLINTEAERLFNLNTDLNQDTVSEALLAAPYRGGTRETAKALNLVLNEGLFNSNSGGRNKVPYILIVIVDGPSPNLQKTAAVAKKLRDRGIRIITIGINNYVHEELVEISGNSRNVFYSCSYRTFVYEISGLLKHLCGVIKEPVPEIEITLEKEKGCLSPETNICQQICNDTDDGVECSCREGYVVSASDPSKCDIKPCKHHVQADVIFIVDSSDSIKDSHYVKALNFVSHFVDSFPIGVNDVQVAALIYSWNVVKLFDLNTFSKKEDIKKAISSAQHLKTSTMTGKALSYVYQNKMFDSENGGRLNISQIVIVMTDGKANYPDHAYKAAEYLKSQGVHIITIGIGKKIDKEELGDLASDKASRFLAASYDVLEFMESELIDRTCTASVIATPD